VSGLDPIGGPDLPQALLSDAVALVVLGIRQARRVPEPAPPADDVIDALGEDAAVTAAPFAPVFEDVLDAFVRITPLDENFAKG